MSTCPQPQSVLSNAVAGCDLYDVECFVAPPSCLGGAQPPSTVAYTQKDVTGAPAAAWSAFVYVAPSALLGSTISLQGGRALDCTGSKFQQLASLQTNAPALSTQDLGSSCSFLPALPLNDASFLLLKSVGVPAGTNLTLWLASPLACSNSGGSVIVGPAVVGGIFAAFLLSAILFGVRFKRDEAQTHTILGHGAPPILGQQQQQNLLNTGMAQNLLGRGRKAPSLLLHHPKVN